MGENEGMIVEEFRALLSSFGRVRCLSIHREETSINGLLVWPNIRVIIIVQEESPGGCSLFFSRYLRVTRLTVFAGKAGYERTLSALGLQFCSKWTFGGLPLCGQTSSCLPSAHFLGAFCRGLKMEMGFGEGD